MGTTKYNNQIVDRRTGNG